MRPVFAPWLEPFADLGARTLSLRHAGGTDHESFDAVGLPGFQFIQDPMDYFGTTHHTSNDTFDHVKAEDLMQATAIITTFVIQTANRPDLLPRKPLPEPEPAPK